MSQFILQGLGWIPDLPDPRDYSVNQEEIHGLLSRLDVQSSAQAVVDLRDALDGSGNYFPPVEKQQLLHSSTTTAVLDLIEYFERRTRGQTIEGSKLFLYKMARTLRRTSGDNGVDLRTTLKALVRFGVPPFDLWHTESSRYDEEPPCSGYVGYVRDFDDLKYFRLDAESSSGLRQQYSASHPLPLVKSFLSAGFPVAFGFSVPRSISESPDIPFRPSFDSYCGGASVLAVGYNDNHFASQNGSLLIRTCWGEHWGDAGYGWLPYAFVEQGLARDFWTVIRESWLDPTELSLPYVLKEEAHANRN